MIEATVFFIIMALAFTFADSFFLGMSSEQFENGLYTILVFAVGAFLLAGISPLSTEAESFTSFVIAAALVVILICLIIRSVVRTARANKTVENIES